MSSLLRSVRVARHAKSPLRFMRNQPTLSAAFSSAAARFYADYPEHVIIDMPALSPTMEQGSVGPWHKKIGEKLSPGDVLVEIETDKATMDFEFQEDGYLAKVLLPEGSKDVPVGQPLGVYVEDESSVSAFEKFTLEDAGGAKAPAPSSAPKEKEEAPAAEKQPAAESAKPAPAASPTVTPTEVSAPTGKVFASPLAKTLALEKGIKLSDVKGTGPNGRIIARDVEAFKPAASPSPAVTASSSAPAYEDIPVTGMRATIAKRLRQSKNEAPDFIVSSTVSVSKLLQLRASLNAASNGAYKISVNDILIKAIALASRKVPAANTHWLEDQKVLRQFHNVDVSVAVSTPKGLITPVVPNVNGKGLAEISAQAKDLAKRARDSKLKPEEYQGGTITISNMGMNHAVSIFTAIINPPQSTILAVGTVERRAVEDPLAENGIAFDDVMTLTGTFDHRVVDGAVGGEWMKELKNILENPLQLLL